MKCKLLFLIFILILVTCSIAVAKIDEPIGNEVNLSPELKHRLNVFMTNFSEVLLEPFEKGNVSNHELIRFGICHNEINNPNLIQVLGKKRRISSKVVEKAIKKYFGISKVKHTSIVSYKYQDGYYIIPKIEKTHVGISEVERVVDVGNACFVLVFRVYPAPPGTRDIEKFLETINTDILDIDYMQATIKKVNDNGAERYILIDYTLKFTSYY